MRILGAIVAAAALIAGGCGSGGGADPTTSGGPASTATAPATSTAGATGTSSVPAPGAAIVVRVDGDTVEGGGRHAVAAGDTVSLRVEADVADEVHVHGYDEAADVAPGRPATIVFRADIPGVFEVELESRGLEIAELVVR